MSVKSTIGKTLVLLMLIFILIVLGLFWFDYLGVVQFKTVFAPVYKLLGLEPQTVVAVEGQYPFANLDDDRFEKRLDSLSMREQEIEKKIDDLTRQEAQNQQIAQELENRIIAQDEREQAFTDSTQKYTDRELNVRANAEKLGGMPPEAAVAILIEMEDQDLIDTLRKVDEIAAESNSSSIVAYWLSLMPADRVAEVQRKMLDKPTSLN